jgi:hypothetical protein
VAPLLEVDPNPSAVLEALTKLGPAAAASVKRASRVTADRVAAEYRSRAKRAKTPTVGGVHTADRVTVDETYNGDGYVVIVPSPDRPGLPGWIEHGTQFVPASPTLFPSAQQQAGPHLRRVAEALQDAIDGTGLGD